MCMHMRNAPQKCEEFYLVILPYKLMLCKYRLFLGWFFFGFNFFFLMNYPFQIDFQWRVLNNGILHVLLLNGQKMSYIYFIFL